MIIKAEDAGVKPLSSTANILIEVKDIQDQKPFFVNAPYSVSIPENVPEGAAIFEIKVRDGDTGIPRNLNLEIVGDTEDFFELEEVSTAKDGVLTASLKKKPGTILDRELPVRFIPEKLVKFVKTTFFSEHLERWRPLCIPTQS